MSSRSSDLSDESDIEIDFGDDYSNCRGENDMNIYLEDDTSACDMMSQHFWDESSDEDFDGYDADWRMGDFKHRKPKSYNLRPGSTVQHPEEAGPAQYFELFLVCY